MVMGDSMAQRRGVSADRTIRECVADRFDVTAWAWQEFARRPSDRRGSKSRRQREHVFVLTRRK